MKKIIVFSLLVIIVILFSVQIRRGALSLLILIDAVRSPARPVMGTFIPGPDVKRVSVSSGDRVIHADLYRPRKDGRFFPLLLVHDLGPAGKDDEHVVLLATDLARAGFLVLVPDLQGMKTLRPRTSDAEDVLQSFMYLSRTASAGPRGGIAGIGYGAGPLLLAAADARIRDKVSVVTTVGGYYDLRNVALFALTGAYEHGEDRGHVRPDMSLRWMFAYKNLDLVSSVEDREKLRKIIELRNRYDMTAADRVARSLGNEGRALYDFLINNDPGRFTPLYERLSLAVREQVYQLSPARAVDYITASFIIVHATDDYAIPYTESQRLADAVADKGRVHCALLPQFMQGEPIEPSIGDRYKRYVLGGWRLFRVMYELLGKAE